MTNYFSNLGVAEIKLETSSLKQGDEIIISGPGTGVIQTKVEEIRVGLVAVDEAKKGEQCSIPVGVKVRRSDKLYRLVDASESCEPGEVRITPGYQLRAQSVIHTVAPTWMDGAHGEPEALGACYTEALKLARKQGFRTLAFPSLGSGRQPQIPLEVAAPIAIHSIQAFLEESPIPEKVFLVCFDTTTYQAYQKVLREALP